MVRLFAAPNGVSMEIDVKLDIRNNGQALDDPAVIKDRMPVVGNHEHHIRTSIRILKTQFLSEKFEMIWVCV